MNEDAPRSRHAVPGPPRSAERPEARVVAAPWCAWGRARAPRCLLQALPRPPLGSDGVGTQPGPHEASGLLRLGDQQCGQRRGLPQGLARATMTGVRALQLCWLVCPGGRCVWRAGDRGWEHEGQHFPGGPSQGEAWVTMGTTRPRRRPFPDSSPGPNSGPSSFPSAPLGFCATPVARPTPRPTGPWRTALGDPA